MRRILLVLVLLTTLVGGMPAGAAPELCFTETGACVDERFVGYWSDNGGLPVFGLPLGPARDAYNRDLGRVIWTQWFERARLEWHPDNPAGFQVLLGRLGETGLLNEGRLWRVERGPTPPSGCRYFPETERSVCDQAPGLGFRSFWEGHGLNDPRLDGYQRSLQLFGLPLTEARMETNPDGAAVLTQWFERARLEWHPNKPAQFKVLLGLLGKEQSGYGAPSGTLPQQLTPFGSSLVYSDDDGARGRELWISDGSSARLIVDIQPGPGSSEPRALADAAGRLFVSADDGMYGREFWMSDGFGAQLVADIRPGAVGSDPAHGVALANQALFFADDGVHGRELWVSDGSIEGTRLLADIRPGPMGSEPKANDPLLSAQYRLTVSRGWVYFYADDGVRGAELWRSDGVVTEPVADLAAGPTSAQYLEIVADGRGGVFVAGWEPSVGYGLWHGRENLRLVRAFPEPPSIPSFRPEPTLRDLTLIDGWLVFGANTDEHGWELWRSDGSSAGTTLIADIQPGRGSGAPGRAYSLGGAIVVRAMAEDPGLRGWWQVGPAGELKRLVLPLGTTGLVSNGRLYVLEATDALGSGGRLWASDGGAAWPLRGMASAQSVEPVLVAAPFGVWLAIGDSERGYGLWRSDGSLMGTRPARY